MALFWQKGGKEDKSAKAAAPKKSGAKAAAKAPKKAAPKKTESKAVAVAKPAPEAKAVKGAKGEIAFPKNSVLKRPRVTEKAGMLSEKGIYTFEVASNANSFQIAKAIQEAYKVSPVKISIARIPAKSMYVRGKRGKTSSGKKAYVFLKKGDTIEFI